MIILTRTFVQQVELLRETFDCLRQRKLSVNLPKSKLCFSVVEWLEMVIDRSGIRPAPSKTEAITQLSQPSTVEEVRVLLGMAGYLRKFVPNYSSVLAPISDLLRDSRFRSKKARRLKVPWGQAQTEADTGQPPHIPTHSRATRLEQTVLAKHGRQQNRSGSSPHLNLGNGRENPSVCKPSMVEDRREKVTN